MASLVVAPDRDHSTVRSVQLVQLAPLGRARRHGVVRRHGRQEHASRSSTRVDEVTLAMASGHLTRGHGRPDNHRTPATPLPTGNAVADRLVESSRAVLTTQDVAGDLYVGGLARLPGSFGAIDTVREVLSLLEKQLVVVSLLRDVMDRGLSVAIGNETGVDPLADCSLVVAPYVGEGNQSGTIGLLGPTRMNYPHAMAAVAVVSQSLGKRLSEG